MKKIEKSFYEYFNTLIHNKIFKRLNVFIKTNVWIVPLIYFVGTIALIIRNKAYGLPFSPISLIQFAVIVVYVGIFLIMYALIEYSTIQLIELLKKILNREKNVILKFILQLISYIIFVVTICYILRFIIGNIVRALLLCIAYYMFFPIMMMITDSEYKIINLMTIILYITLILEIPISLGGFKGKEVIYHDIESSTNKEYIYYGNYDGLYQLSDNDNVYLIPIDNGYIMYPKNND